VKPWLGIAGCFLGCVLTGFGQSTNRLLWQVPTGRYVFSTPALDRDGTIYIGSANGRLYALRPDGTVKWTFLTGAEIQSSPAIGRDGTIYFGSADRRVYALNPDGSKKWDFLTGDLVLCSPTLGADGTVYIGSRDGYYYALDGDGTMKWRFGTGRYYTDMPAVIGPEGTILVSGGGTIYALKRDGEERWRKSLGPSMLGVAMAIGRGGRIYATVAEDGPGRTLLFALTQHGEIIWRFSFGQITAVANPCFPTIGRDETIYLATPDAMFYAIHQDGTLKWSVPATRSQSSPALGSDGKIYLNSSWDFRLLCYDLDGRLEWEQALGVTANSASGLTSSFPTLQDGVVYIGAGNGSVFAIQGSGELEASSWPAFGRDAQHTGRDIQRGIESVAETATANECLGLTVEPGRRYVIQGSADLREWEDCTNIVSTTTLVTVPRVGNYRYYRLAVPE
jgi:outer membrane protein assembly factor BamB